jgi:SAM-dependent methyltransferase
MGTAEIQGELWGARARDWATLQEPAWRPIYREALLSAGVGPGTRVLDVGCGAGGALAVARELGAEPLGFDASEALAAIARERLPGVHVEVGEMEALPFDDSAFDLVTGFNSFQFAANVVGALSEACRVCRRTGCVFMFVWGRREDCELVSGVLPAIMALLPPSPVAGLAPFDFGAPGVVEELMEKAGLRPRDSGEIDGVLVWPDAATSVRAIASAGPSTRAIRQAGEAAVAAALHRAVQPYVQADGSVMLHNRFRWVIGSPA